MAEVWANSDWVVDRLPVVSTLLPKHVAVGTWYEVFCDDLFYYVLIILFGWLLKTRNQVSYGYVARSSDETWTHSFLHPSHRISRPHSLKRDPRDIFPAVSVLTWLFAVTSLTAILAPHCAGNLYFYLWRTACVFFLFFRLLLSLSRSLSPPPLFNTQDALPFFDLSSVELLQTGTCRVDGTGGQTLYRERVSIGCCRKSAAFVYQIKISVWKSETRVTKFCPSVLFCCFVSTAWAARTIQSTILEAEGVSMWRSLIVIAVLVRFELLTTVTVKMASWRVTPCCFGGTCCHQYSEWKRGLYWRWKQRVTSKRWHTSTKFRRVTSDKNVLTRVLSAGLSSPPSYRSCPCPSQFCLVWSGLVWSYVRACL